LEEQQQLMEDEIDLREIFQTLRRRAKVIIGTTLVCAVVMAILSFFVLTPVYEATTTLFAGRATVTPEMPAHLKPSRVKWPLQKNWLRITEK